MEKGGNIRLPDKPAQTVPLPAHPGDLMIRDLNGDGYPDLIVAMSRGGRDAPSMIFLSDKGRFGRPAWTSNDEGANCAIEMGDLDRDGDDDLIIGRFNQDPAVAYRNKGGGAFEENPFWFARIKDDSTQVTLVAGDFNGDGYIDLFASDRIYPGAPEGLRNRYSWCMDKEDGGLGVSALSWTDVDRDGRKDMVVASWLGGTAYEVFRGLEKDFERTSTWKSPLEGEFTSLATGDVTGDGYPEIFVGSAPYRGGDGRIRMFANHGGRMDPEPSWISADVDCPAADLALQDFDRDGDLDLVALAGAHSAIYENRQGVLETQPCWRADLSGGVLRVADLNRDGWLDLAVASTYRQKPEIAIYLADPAQRSPPARPFPDIPALPPLTRFDLLPDVAAADLELIARYRQERRITPALRYRAPQILSALEILGIRTLPKLEEELRPEVESRIHRMLRAHYSEHGQEEALRHLIQMGPVLRPILESHVPDGLDGNGLDLAREAVRRIQASLAGQSADAVELWGMKIGRLTPRLRQRYGLGEVQGVVVLEIPERLGPTLDLANLREGDVITGLGSFLDYGRDVEPVDGPKAFLQRILELHEEDYRNFQPKPDWALIGYQYVCGPLHPSVQGETRQGRMRLEPEHLQDVRRSVREPRIWRPGEF